LERHNKEETLPKPACINQEDSVQEQNTPRSACAYFPRQRIYRREENHLETVNVESNGKSRIKLAFEFFFSLAF